MRNTICILGLRVSNKVCDLFVSLFVTLYLYELSNGNVSYICEYWFAFFLSLVGIMTILSPIFSKRRFRKILLILGCIGRLAFMGLMIVISDKCIDYLIPLAIFNGASTGIYYTTYNIYEAEGIIPEARRKVIGIYEVLSGSIKVIFPFISGWIIYNWGMSAGAICAICMAGASVIFSILYIDNGDSLNSKYSIKEFIKSIKSNSNTYRISKIYFINTICRGETVSYGAFEVFLSVYTIMVFHSSISIGSVTAICHFLAICFSMIFATWSKKLGNKITNLHIVAWVIIAALAMITVIFSSPYTLFIMLGAFNIAKSIDSCIYSSAWGGFSSLEDVSKYKPELYWISECTLTIGRILGFTVLIIYSLYNDSAIICMGIYGITLILVSLNQKKFYDNIFNI